MVLIIIIQNLLVYCYNNNSNNIQVKYLEEMNSLLYYYTHFDNKNENI